MENKERAILNFNLFYFFKPIIGIFNSGLFVDNFKGGTFEIPEECENFELSTFEEQYNFDYYKDLMVACGFDKDVDWIEYNIKIPKTIDDKVNKVADRVQEQYKLRNAEKGKKKAFMKKYAPGIFKLLDEAYGPLYGVVPYTDKVRQQIIDQFNLFISLDYISMVVDENDDVVAFGFAIPSLSEVVNKYEGRLTPFSILPILKAANHPKQLDLALIAVKPGWRTKGVPALIFREMLTNFIKNGIESVETNLMLEENHSIQQLWKDYEHRQHKRRRSWVKSI